MQWSILAGDKKTGITTMQMDEGLDTGDMLLKKEVQIEDTETGESLHDKLAALGSDLLLETLKQAQAGTLRPQPQKDEESTYAKMLTKELGKIDWNRDALEIERYIRGLNSWPSAYTGYKGKTLKIWKAQLVSDEDEPAEPGTVTAVEKNSFIVQAGNGKLRILEVQLQGKKRMETGSFLRGVKLEKGDVLCM
jgi:methionyl-tRNA formyltransferase